MNTASYGLELFFALSIWGEAHTKGIDTRLECHDSGASPGFGRGEPRIFFRFGNLHVAERHAAHGEAMRFARGVRGHAPRLIFFKMVRFGVYFDQLLSLKNFKNANFLYKNFKNCNLHT